MICPKPLLGYVSPCDHGNTAARWLCRMKLRAMSSNIEEEETARKLLLYTNVDCLYTRLSPLHGRRKTALCQQGS